MKSFRASAGAGEIDPEVAWKAVASRDAEARFFYGVMTTGVYCRPSCSSRRPLRKNVRFYATPDEAERDGLRACLRCDPKAERRADPAAAEIQDAVRFLEEHSGEAPSLGELARRSGLSAAYFQKTFRRLVGLSPKQYLDSVRMRKLKAGLAAGKDVTETIYASGYGSASRVYERAGSELGMTPAQYRAGGRGVSITYAEVASPLGRMMLGATSRGLCFLQFGESDADLLSKLRKEYPLAGLEPMAEPRHPDFDGWIEALNGYLAGIRTSLDLPLDVRGTAFQMRVWKYLQSIPYGEARSYSEVAAGIGEPKAVRAVATACARNTVGVLIPCHRVIRSNGELGGYRWGLERKRVLIDTERAGRPA